MRLNWIRLFDPVDNNTVQEIFIEREHKMFKNGRTLVRCPVCKQWVSKHDYENYCKHGYHEYSEPVQLFTS